MKKFSDFAEEHRPLDGDKIKIKRVLEREIKVTGYKITRSKYKDNGSGQCMTLQFELDGERRVLFTGSEVLIEQIEKYADEIPFLATIKRIDKFYTFT